MLEYYAEKYTVHRRIECAVDLGRHLLMKATSKQAGPSALQFSPSETKNKI
jgi:hypothetical protein